MLLLGAVATLSRAGMLALVAGLIVLCAFLGARRVVSAGLAPATGAGVAFGGLLVAMPLASAPHQLVPIMALPAGITVAVALGRWSPSRQRLLLVSTALAVGVLLLARTGAVHRATGEVALMRAHAKLPGPGRRHRGRRPHRPRASGRRRRTGRRMGPLEQRGRSDPDHAVRPRRVPPGSGRARLRRTDPAAGVLVGSGLLVRRAIRRDGATTLPAAVAAATAAVAVHGGFDFVWHVPVVPLVFAALLGLLTEPAPQILAGPTGSATPRRGDLT